jgi:hypothetical protein
MKQELGMPQSAPNAEEVTMDETDYMDQTMDDGALTAGENVDIVPSVGGLGAPAYYQAAQKSVDDQIKANIALLTSAQTRLRERRVGPSDSEKWLAIAAALGQPTRTGAFGESLGNVAKTLGEQKSARRKEREAQEALLEKYGLEIGNEQLRMLQSGLSQAGQLYRAEMAANKKPKGAQPKATVGPDFVPRTRYGTEVKTPPTAAVYTLREYLSNPSNSEENKKIARRNFDNKFGFGTAELFGGEE